MKKNLLFKWVSVLGAILLLANVALPGMMVYAENYEGQQQQQEQQNNESQEQQQWQEQNQQEESDIQGCEWSEVAQIWEHKYCTLKDAIDEADSSNETDITITLLTDITLDDNTSFPLTKKITIDWKEKTISSKQDATYGSAIFRFEQWSEWSTIKNLTIDASPAWSQQAMIDFMINFGSSDDETTIENVTFKWATTCSSIWNELPIQSQGQVAWKILIKNNTFTNVKYWMYFNSLKDLTIEDNTITCTKYNAIHLAEIENGDNISINNNELANIWQNSFSVMYNAWIALNDNWWTITMEWNTIDMNLDYPEIWYYGQKTITFDSDWWTEVEKQYLKSNEKIVEPINITKEWYALDWWYNETTKWNFDSNTIGNEDITLKAKWVSTAWEISSIHALPAVLKWEADIEVKNIKSDEKVWTFKSADGTYTVSISEDGKTITYSNISLKDPGEADNENGHRPSGYIWMWARFYHPEAIMENATFREKELTETNRSNWFNDVWFWISAQEIEDNINAGVYTKELTVKASRDGTEQQEYKIVIDLNKIAIVYTDDESKTTNVIKVEDKEIKELNWKVAYTITFDTDWWSVIASISANEWDEITAPANPTKDGYTFAGWDKTIPTTMPAENLTIKAKWNVKSSGGSSSWGGGSKSTTKTTTTDTEKTTTDAKATDTKSDTNTTVDNNNKGSNNDNYVSTYNPEFSQEFNDAYNFARKNGITTMSNIEEADMYGPLTRVAMAKMLSQYAINVLGQAPDTSKVVPAFSDVDPQLNADYNNWVTLAYQLGIMWIGIENYRPYDLVTRAEFGTALSRMLYGLADGQWDEWYSTHLSKLMNEEIITVDTPNLQELRGYVMIMLMRSAQS